MFFARVAGCVASKVLSEQPRRVEKHREFCGAGCAAKHRARRLAFWLVLGTAPQERREQRSWPRSGEGQDARSHAKSDSLAIPPSGNDERGAAANAKIKPIANNLHRLRN